MSNGFKKGELTQFEQYVVDKLDHINKHLSDLPCENDGYDLPDRIQKLEYKAKWYSAIFGGIWAVTGGLIVVAVEFLLHRLGGR
jgi:hypothetical protein